MPRKKIGSGDIDVLLIGGLAVGAYFFVIKPLLGGLGLSTDPTISAEQQLAGTANPFNYQFQPFVDFYNNNVPQIVTGGGGNFITNLFYPAQTGLISNPTVQQFFQYLKANPGAASPWGYIDTADYSARSESLYNALSVSAINPLSTSDQVAALSALSGLSNQLQVAFIANYFWWNFQTDLLTFLNGSIVKSGLTSSNLVEIINYVNSLPVNPS